MRTPTTALIAALFAIATTSVAGAAQTAVRGPWLLTTLPGMGTVTWRCDPAREARGLPALALGVNTSSATATETVTFRTGGKTLRRKVMQPGERLELPYLKFIRQQLSFAQSTEPGTLRAIVTVDFSPRPVSPSHCFPYLPPALVVRLSPR